MLGRAHDYTCLQSDLGFLFSTVVVVVAVTVSDTELYPLINAVSENNFIRLNCDYYANRNCSLDTTQRGHSLYFASVHSTRLSCERECN